MRADGNANIDSVAGLATRMVELDARLANLQDQQRILNQEWVNFGK